jgi:hypothetical protein
MWWYLCDISPYIKYFIALITDRRNSFHYSLLQRSNFFTSTYKVQLLHYFVSKTITFRETVVGLDLQI